jgi:hypothetical protein
MMHPVMCSGPASGALAGGKKIDFWRRLAAGCLLAACGSLQWGCTTANVGADAADLEKVMEANHRAAIAILANVNERSRPFLIQQETREKAFSQDRLFLVSPDDIAAWDKILTGLDNYCAALSNFTSGKYPDNFTAATEALALNMQALAQTANFTAGSSAAACQTAVTELGTILLKHQVNGTAVEIAKDAEPHFQSVVRGLIDALGFVGSPPSPADHGMLASYEAGFEVFTAEQTKQFREGKIPEYDTMTPAGRKAAISDFVAWQKLMRENQELVESLKTLAASLDRAASAHTQLATGSEASAAQAMAALKADVQNASAIYQKYRNGG